MVCAIKSCTIVLALFLLRRSRTLSGTSSSGLRRSKCRVVVQRRRRRRRRSVPFFPAPVVVNYREHELRASRRYTVIFNRCYTGPMLRVMHRVIHATTITARTLLYITTVIEIVIWGHDATRRLMRPRYLWMRPPRRPVRQYEISFLNRNGNLQNFYSLELLHVEKILHSQMR